MYWAAHYSDGSVLLQKREDGAENIYADIDRSRLVAFGLHRDDGERLFLLHLDPGQRLIYRRRVEKRMDGSPDMVVYLVGWQKSVNGANVQSIAYVSESGEVHLAGAWRDDHPWFYSVQPVAAEEELANGQI